MAGVGVLAVAITAAVTLVLDFLFGRTQTLLTSGVLATLLLWWWIVLPIIMRRRTDQDPLPSED